jgi:DNA-binding SARP family transcriptional activator
MYAANLRRVLRSQAAAPTVSRLDSGYQLAIDPAALDVSQFRYSVEAARQAISQGRYAAALREFDVGLARWRGDALAGLPLGDALSSWCAAVEQERLAALEDRGLVLLAMGVADRAAAAASEVLVCEPLRERAHALLIRACYQAGDVAGSLSAYEVARRNLVEELGVEPGEELRELNQAVLNRAQILTGASPLPMSAHGQPPD